MRDLLSRMAGSAAQVLMLSLLSGAVIAAQPQPGSGQPGKIRGKPRAPIEVHYQLLGTPEVGKPLDVELSLRPLIASQAVSASFGESHSLTLTRQGAPRRHAEPVDLPGILQVVTLVPESEGVHDFKVFATVWVDGSPQTRVVSIPVQVGDQKTFQAAEPVVNGKLITDANGESVVSMPAETTIRD